MEKSPCKLNLLHCRQKTTTSLWKRDEKGIGTTRKMRPQANNAQYNTQGCDMRGGVEWEDRGRAGVGGSFVLTYIWAGEMVWQYIYFPTLIKKGTFTYSDSNPGDSRSQKMWRCCSQIASDYMKSYINPLRLVSAPPPPPLPAPPLVSQARVLIATLVTLTHGTQGCPKTTSFDKSTWHSTFEKSLQSSFSLPLGTRTFLQHPLPENALPFPSVFNPRILFPFSLSLRFFTLP